MTIDDFHGKVLSELSDLKAGQSATTAELRNVVQRQDKANGSVGRHEEKLGLLQLELANRASEVKADLKAELNSHISGCPMKGRMDAVEDFVIAAAATNKANAHWLNRLWPAFYAAAGVGVYIAAMHASDVLQAMTHH